MRIVDHVLSRCAEGFTIGQKLGWTVLTALVDDVTVTVDAGRVTLALRISRQVAVEA